MSLPYSIPPEWERALRSQFSVASLRPSKPFSHVRDFGWLTYDLPSQFFTRSSFHWYVELVGTLREALAHFAHAAGVTPNVWTALDGLHVYHQDELEVRYRFHVGSRLADVAYLLDRREGYSTAFRRAREHLRQLQASLSSRLEALRVPVSLVIKPEQWTPTLLNEVASICKVHRPSSSLSEWFAYEIVDIQLDLQDTKLPETALLALMSFLQSDVPLSAMRLTIQDAQWTWQDVVALINAIDRPSINSLKIILPPSLHYESVMRALGETKHLRFVDITVNTLKPTEVFADTTVRPSSIQALRWTSTSLNSIPRQFAGLTSLGLSWSHETWASQLQVIGQQLLMLQLFPLNVSARDTIPLNAVLEACPKILCLELTDAKIDSLDALIDGYEAGSCRIRSVALRAVTVTQTDSVSRLTAMLKDHNTQGAQNLLEFSWLPASEDIPNGLIGQFADVLDANSRIQLLELQCSGKAPAMERLLRHHSRPLLPYDHPLLCEPSEALGYISQLSHDVIGHILAFAGIHGKRRVRIHCSKHGRYTGGN